MPYKNRNTHTSRYTNLAAMWPFINKQPQKKGVKQLSYNNSFTETIINQTCLQKDKRHFFFFQFCEIKTWERFWTSKIQNKTDCWKASTLENTKGMEQCRTNLKSLTAFDTYVYCQGFDFFSRHEEERITGLLRSLQHPLHSLVQTSCYRLVLP